MWVFAKAGCGLTVQPLNPAFAAGSLSAILIIEKNGRNLGRKWVVEGGGDDARTIRDVLPVILATAVNGLVT
jgi:hypothetical protein